MHQAVWDVLLELDSVLPMEPVSTQVQEKHVAGQKPVVSTASVRRVNPAIVQIVEVKMTHVAMDFGVSMIARTPQPAFVSAVKNDIDGVPRKIDVSV